jgi:23S rRNA pseudouridine2605 synthase
MPESSSSSAAPHAERLQKLLAAAGLGSRRHCEEYILAGRVTVDGQVVTQLGVKVDLHRQQVAVDGERLRPHKKVYYLVNKPSGYLSTTADPSGRPRVIDLVPPSEARLFTVGRLDENTEGLLLVTNDGELAHRLAHPRFQVERVYRALVAGQPGQETLNELQRGMHFAEGKFRVRSVRIVKSQGRGTVLELVLTEGQNREVRRLLARVGHKVMALKRIAFGPLKLADLDPGAYRPLRPHEIDELHDYVSGKKRPPPRKKSHPGPRGARRPPQPSPRSSHPPARKRQRPKPTRT